VLFLTYLIIAKNTFEGIFTLGEFTLLIQLVFQVRQPLFASSFIVDNIQQAEAGSKDFFEVMSIKPAIADEPSARRLSVSKGRVEFSGVNFAYSAGTSVIRGVSFSIEPGTKLALIGQSGEGKSTIANLLLRLYEPTKGQILVDDQNVNKVTQLSLRQNIAVVFQDASLFSGTVIENISYGKPRASKAEIEAAAKAANAHHFVKKLPEGYETEIGERGIKLSGGQKQRIAIARAILKDAPILILDEATSSLDSKSEQEVQKALDHLMKGRTTLIIAHRLSTIRDVDTIVSLKGGRVEEYGSPASLRRQKGIYAELLNLQDPTKANKKELKRYEIVAR
jgi:ATP-binding cassette subfamily B protein